MPKKSHEIFFKCNKCGRHLAAPFSKAGFSAPCPRCGAEVAIPFRSERFAFKCTCGSKLHSKRSLVGARYRCKRCRKVHLVPQPQSSSSGVEGPLPVARLLSTYSTPSDASISDDEAPAVRIPPLSEKPRKREAEKEASAKPKESPAKEKPQKDGSDFDIDVDVADLSDITDFDGNPLF